ncbi:hypothetical protein [Edaphobacter modestus]|uniref:Uncharacterized protein n=1 Tax=Edaphobacter modestus TaxID=388466 RepID=A0A4Q7YWX4_9BACT|nr:hypothetical protein [Edaphobacter modestus]RZU41569.1 hypothetical protein BDD14_3094 [Edaphobacter modestus]
MGRKKLLVIGGAVASCPVILIASFLVANKFYTRFIFKGEMSDFAPGDSFGVILYAFLFTFLLLIPVLLGWWWLYRRISD